MSGRGGRELPVLLLVLLSVVPLSLWSWLVLSRLLLRGLLVLALGSSLTTKRMLMFHSFSLLR